MCSAAGNLDLNARRDLELFGRGAYPVSCTSQLWYRRAIDELEWVLFTSIATYCKEQRFKVLLIQNVSDQLSFVHTVNTQAMLFEDKPGAVLHLAIVGVGVKVHIQLGVQKWISA